MLVVSKTYRTDAVSRRVHVRSITILVVELLPLVLYTRVVHSSHKSIFISRQAMNNGDNLNAPPQGAQLAARTRGRKVGRNGTVMICSDSRLASGEPAGPGVPKRASAALQVNLGWVPGPSGLKGN